VQKATGQLWLAGDECGHAMWPRVGEMSPALAEGINLKGDEEGGMGGGESYAVRHVGGLTGGWRYCGAAGRELHARPRADYRTMQLTGANDANEILDLLTALCSSSRHQNAASTSTRGSSRILRAIVIRPQQCAASFHGIRGIQIISSGAVSSSSIFFREA